MADAASQRRNVDSMLSLVSNIGRIGGMRADLMFGDEWNTLQVPTLMIVGDRDKFGSPDDAETATKFNESIEINKVHNAGHLPWIDQPEPVAERIRHFLNT